jgi:O-6-methylguanine DNA methyltransferase
MHSNHSSAIRYHFRQPGSRLRGPIRYAIGQTALGAVLIGHSQPGVCAIFLDDQACALPPLLRAAFPGTELREAPQLLRHEMCQILDLLHGKNIEDRLTLDIGGTAFQQKVWRALCDIPAGQTRSYAQLAAQLGAPQAARAVGSACAANLLAVAIPCHRVLRHDGSITGYRWGAERKRALLDRELAPRMDLALS